VTLIRLWTMFLESEGSDTICVAPVFRVTECAEKDHFLRPIQRQRYLFHSMTDTSNSQRLKGIAFPVLTLMDLPKAELALPPCLKRWLAHSCTGTVFGVVHWC